MMSPIGTKRWFAWCRTISGVGAMAIATLVERHTRYVMLAKVAARTPER